MKYITGALVGAALLMSGTAFAATVAVPATYGLTSLVTISTPTTSLKGNVVYKFVDGKTTCYAYTAGGISCVK